MKHGSLFSGGGGFDLAAEFVGWQNVFHCERDAFCQAILKYYWPDSASLPDIKEFDGRPYKGQIDVLTGGFPCQPFSIAGKRRGTEDDRYLWPEMLRLIGEIQPRWIVGENVYGLINWNEGLVFEQVLSDLEAQGYDVQTYLLPAASVNAPHQRFRVWIVAFNACYAATRTTQAYPDTGSLGWDSPDFSRMPSGRRELRQYFHPDLLHLAQLETTGSGEPMARDWRSWPTQSPLCRGDDGLPRELDGIAFSRWREQSIKLYGNAIVPQVALQIFSTIKEFENSHSQEKS